MILIDLATLCRPHPRRWLYPLSLLKEDGRTLVCQSGLSRIPTRLFLREHRLLEFFDDILYDNLSSPTITDLRHLPPLCKRQWTRTRMDFTIHHTTL